MPSFVLLNQNTTVPKVVEKNQVGKISKRPKIPRNHKIFRIEKFQFPVYKGILVHF